MALVMSNCSRVKEGAKNAIHTGGELVGKAGSELAEGISDGVSDKFGGTILWDESLTKQGVSHGRWSATPTGDHPAVSLYMIFESEYKGQLRGRLLDGEGLEYGRTKVEVSGESGDAKYIDFPFDKPTEFILKSTLVIEELDPVSVDITQ